MKDSNTMDIVRTNTKVLYLGHLPRGFCERALKGYISQFTNVVQLKVARSKRTGNPKGYAFVQVVDKGREAQDVADTLNGRLMFNKIVQCKIVSDPHKKTFKNANRAFKKPTANIRAMRRHNAPKSAKQLADNTRRAVSKVKKTNAKMAALGIDFAFEHPAEKKATEEATKQKATEEPASPPQKRAKTVKSPKPATMATPEAKQSKKRTLEDAETPVMKKAKNTPANSAEKKTPKNSAKKTPKSAEKSSKKRKLNVETPSPKNKKQMKLSQD